jgi:hypothetical protein
MVNIPSMLLGAPVGGKRVRRPFCNPVVDRHGADKGKHDGEDLNGESDCSETLRAFVQVCEGQQQENIQQSGARHPKRHDTTKQDGEGRSHENVSVRRLPVEVGMGEYRDI